MKTTELLHVYLLNDAVYIAAESEQSARQLNEDQEGGEPEDDCRIGDSDGYYRDSLKGDQAPDSTMLEAARAKLADHTPPFVVGYSLHIL